MPNLNEVQDRTLYEPAHTVFFSPDAWVLLLAAFEFLEDPFNWSAVSNIPTPSERDEIEALVAKAYDELMTSQIGSVHWLTGACPQGMLVCDGTVYARVDYPALYDYMAAIFHVDSDNFAVPDLRDKVALGTSATRTTGTTGGAETVTLGIGETPAHNHAVADLGHTHAEGIALPALGAALVGIPIPSALPGIGITGFGFASISETTVGGDGSHANMQPFLALLPCIVAF